MAAGKRTRVPHHQGLWERERKDDKVYELKIDGISASYPTGFPLDRVEPPREVVLWWKEKTIQKEKTGLGLPSPKKLDDLAEEAFARLDERIAQSHPKAPSERTVELYRGDYERYVQPVFGSTYAHKIDHDQVLDWIGWLREQKGRGDRTFAEWTVNGKLTVLRHVLRYGRRIRAVDFNVFDWIEPADLPVQDSREEFLGRALTVAELNRLIEAASGEARTVITVLGFTGMRRAECAGLLWSDLDLMVEREIKLTRQLGQTKRVPLKNKWARDVILLDRAHEALIDHLAVEQAKGLGDFGDYVFTDEFGETRKLHWFSDAVQRAGAQAKLGDDVGPQVLRRTTATVFAYSKVPIHAAAKMLGHSTDVFDKHYAQVWKDAQTRKGMRAFLAEVEGFGVREEAA
jgi:integrase